MNIIVSLTTTASRLELLYYTLIALSRQSIEPSSIVVNVSSEPYLNDGGIRDIPAWLEGGNWVVRFVENNGPYRKLLPVIESASDDDVVITADDDVLYGRRWLERFLERINSDPDKIVCARGRWIAKNFLGEYQGYANWRPVSSFAIGERILPIGCGGVAYRKRNLDLRFLFDKAFLKLAPTTDDLWFRIASMRKGTLVLVDPSLEADSIYLEHPAALENYNTNKLAAQGRPILLARAYQAIIRETKDYFGVSRSPNDLAWRRLTDYSRSQLSELE